MLTMSPVSPLSSGAVSNLLRCLTTRCASYGGILKPGMSTRHCATVSIVAVLCCTCAASAQQPEETVLRVTTRLVQVSVVAHDPDGNPIRDLTRDDFTLTDHGRPQPISVFSVQVAEPAESTPNQADTANPLV